MRVSWFINLHTIQTVKRVAKIFGARAFDFNFAVTNFARQDDSRTCACSHYNSTIAHELLKISIALSSMFVNELNAGIVTIVCLPGIVRD